MRHAPLPLVTDPRQPPAGSIVDEPLPAAGGLACRMLRARLHPVRELLPRRRADDQARAVRVLAVADEHRTWACWRPRRSRRRRTRCSCSSARCSSCFVSLLGNRLDQVAGGPLRQRLRPQRLEPLRHRTPSPRSRWAARPPGYPGTASRLRRHPRRSPARPATRYARRGQTGSPAP